MRTSKKYFIFSFTCLLLFFFIGVRVFINHFLELRSIDTYIFVAGISLGIGLVLFVASIEIAGRESVYKDEDIIAHEAQIIRKDNVSAHLWIGLNETRRRQCQRCSSSRCYVRSRYKVVYKILVDGISIECGCEFICGNSVCVDSVRRHVDGLISEEMILMIENLK